jgi:hypothetical protein
MLFTVTGSPISLEISYIVLYEENLDSEIDAIYAD